jgi:alkylation response protein AidB-like acyl-CoA dehydrogenase
MNEAAIISEARDWYRGNWDPARSVGEWFELMHDNRWAYPTWPVEWGGRGLPISIAKQVRAERRTAGALAPPSGIGPSLLAPMLFRHGTDEQCDRYLKGMAYGRITLCQLLSEPDAGSDLAGSRTRAVRDGKEWRMSGTKIWNSNVKRVTYGMMLGRTDWDSPKHAGLTFFLCPANQPGVECHPIKQMNGRDDEFYMVHLNDAIVADEDRLGAVGDGWAVARTFLQYEKNSFNPAAHEGGPFGAVDLGAPAGAVLESLVRPTKKEARGNRGINRVVDDLVQRFGRSDDPLVRQELAKLYTMRTIMGYTNLRMRSVAAPGLEGPISKLTVSEITRRQRELGLRVQGAYGTLIGDASPSARFQDFALSSPATSIAGGTDEIQKNHIAEKVLGLPREPVDHADQPFGQVAQGSSRWK